MGHYGTSTVELAGVLVVLAEMPRSIESVLRFFFPVASVYFVHYECF